MDNNFVKAMQESTNYDYTENGALTHTSTLNTVYDMFAMGAAMRNREDYDVAEMFAKACEENIDMALKCLFYIRDIRGGQGERRFFRICLNHFAQAYYFTLTEKDVENLFKEIEAVGRYDDFYAFVDTPLKKEAFEYLHNRIKLDITLMKKHQPVSLCAKWLKSENTSSNLSVMYAIITRKAFNMTPREYRITLTRLRKYIKIVETTMSQGDWNDIDFATLPSRAGFIYRNAFMNSPVIGDKYKAFIENKNTKVNANTLYPYEIVDKAFADLCYRVNPIEKTMLNKYWENLKDYFNGCTFNGIAMVDTSGSMYGTPFNVAASIGIYCAEKNSGPFGNCYMTFSEDPKFVKMPSNLDIIDKVNIFLKNSIIGSTNIEAAFDLILDTAKRAHLSQDDIPQNLIVISDMEFNRAVTHAAQNVGTLIENIKRDWEQNGYKMPHLIFWNVNARNNNIPMSLDKGSVSYVSGFSPSIFSAILTGKSGLDLMYETIDRPRYDFRINEY